MEVVEEDEDGNKLVNTARLALRAIGAIGDLQKRTKQLEERV